MQEFKRDFIEFSLTKNILRFGEFKLKSGRISPYFFNSGLFNDAESLDRLGGFYATAIQQAQLQFDMLFGPAYKGIPLALTTALSYYRFFNRSVPYCCNRKEVKMHGDGGITFGAEPNGNVLIVDDVISAGTSVGISVDIIKKANATAAGVVVALDRQERGQGRCSAIQEVEQHHGLKVINIISLDDIVEYLKKEQCMHQHLKTIAQYRLQYGVGTMETKI